MKKFSILTILLIPCFLFCGCKTFNKTQYDINDYIASEISKIENIDSLNDETIKTLSVIYRTNLSKIKDLKISKINNRVASLTKDTSNLILDNKINLNISDYTWHELISKSEILEFFNSKNLTLSTLSNIKIETDEFKNAQKLLVASKEIDFIDFLNYFHLPSNNNIKISEQNSFYKIEGFGNGINFIISINDIIKLSNENLTFDQILEILYSKSSISSLE